MAARAINHDTNNNVSYLMSSPKMGRQIHCESRLEHCMALMLEMAPHVISFVEQPYRFRIRQNGLVFTTIPDFEVQLDTGEIDYVEVKYENQAKKKADRFAATAIQLANEGFNYKVKTEKEIRRSHQILHNCLFLKSFKQRSLHDRSQLMAMVPVEPMKFSDLVGEVGSKNTAIEMIAHQLVFCDFYQPITDNSVVRPLREGDFDYLYM